MSAFRIKARRSALGHDSPTAFPFCKGFSLQLAGRTHKSLVGFFDLPRTKVHLKKSGAQSRSLPGSAAYGSRNGVPTQIVIYVHTPTNTESPSLFPPRFELSSLEKEPRPLAEKESTLGICIHRSSPFISPTRQEQTTHTAVKSPLLLPSRPTCREFWEVLLGLEVGSPDRPAWAVAPRVRLLSSRDDNSIADAVTWLAFAPIIEAGPGYLPSAWASSQV